MISNILVWGISIYISNKNKTKEEDLIGYPIKKYLEDTYGKRSKKLKNVTIKR